MKISKVSPAQERVIAENHGLSHYLDLLEEGRPATEHSWLYEKEDSQTTLNRWLEILGSLENGSPFEQKVYQFDTKQIEKFGPQGEVPPISEAIKVESFADQYVPNSGCELQLRNLADICGIRPKSLNYWGLQFVTDDMATRDTLSTNSGWPLFKRRALVRDQTVQAALRSLDDVYQYPAIILFRSYNGKLRVVWMYPMAMNLVEYRATMPLQRSLYSNQYVTPWLGFEHVKRRFTELWKAHPYAFGGDTTAMDAHMQMSQLEMVSSMVNPLFAEPEYMDRSLTHVAEIDLVVGRHSIIRDQQHGIASGSGWTQLSETIFQMGMFDRFISDNSLSLSVEDGMGIGDDYVWFFDEAPESSQIVDFWAKNGLPGKEEKQSNEEEYCTFLQRLFAKGWFSRDDSEVLGGVYPTVRALNSLLNPEKFHNPKQWNSDMFCTRCYMILENCVDHPLFEQFTKFVVSGQKDLLPFAKLSPRELSRIQHEAGKIPGFYPSYNQEKRTKPLSEFTSIKYASTL
jgi:hypothetical protein